MDAIHETHLRESFCEDAICSAQESYFYSASLRARSAEQVHKEAIGARHSFRQLAEERQSGVNISSASILGVNQSAVQIFFTGIMHGEEGRVFRIKFRPKIKSALLQPAIEIPCGDFVGLVEQRIIRLQECDRSSFVGNAWQRLAGLSGNLRGVRGGMFPGPGKIAVVLHPDCSTVLNAIE